MKLVTYTLEYTDHMGVASPSFCQVSAYMSDEQATRMSNAGDTNGFTCHDLHITNPHGETVHGWVRSAGKPWLISNQETVNVCEILVEDAYIEGNRLYVGDSQVYPVFGEDCYIVVYTLSITNRNGRVRRQTVMTTVANTLEEALRESPSSKLSDYIGTQEKLVYTGVNVPLPPEVNQGEVVEVTIQHHPFRHVQWLMKTFAIGVKG